MDTVVNQTYSQYQSSEINKSDLIDPYVLQTSFSPGSEFEGFATATLAGLGLNQPENLSQVGYMNVTVGPSSGSPTEYQGVLHVPENPPSESGYQVGTTYYPSNLTGSPYISTDGEIVEVTEPFKITESVDSDGTNRTQVSYVEKTYTTTSSSDLSALYDELALLRAEIDARQASLSSGGGGGLAGIPGLGGLDPGMRLLVVLSGITAILLFVRD
jgi:hypothetical protein